MRKTKSAILEAVHETAKGPQAASVMDQVTMREFDRLCLPPIKPLQPEEIKQIRETSRVSQAVFAALLNISVSTDSRHVPRGQAIEPSAHLTNYMVED